MRNLYSIRTGLLAVALFIGVPTLPAQTASTNEIEALREQIRLLDEKLRVLERKQELKDEAAAAGTKTQPKLTATDGRIEIASGDGANSLRLRGLVQADSRWYLQGADNTHDSFILRRARLIFEGRFNRNFTYQLVPEFGGGSPALLDANVTIPVTAGSRIKAGKFKVPVGLEQLQSDSSAFFAERSVATALTPNRDVGVQWEGTVLEDRLDYAFGVFNGQPDGGSSNNGADFNDGKTVAARLFAHPFAGNKESSWQGLGLGLGASAGRYVTASGRTSGYRTDGQQSFFAYRGSTVADGDGFVYSPQAYYYAGPFGFLAEYVVSTIDLTNGTSPVRTIRNTGWNLSLGWVLTGESASFRGVTPRTRFDPSAGTWGAIELVARVSGLDVDDAVFTGGPASLADPATGATRVISGGLGLNWYLSPAVRTSIDIFRSDFALHPGATPVAGTLLSEEETVLITRLQVAF